MSSAHSLLRQTIPNTHFPSPTAPQPPPAAPRPHPAAPRSRGSPAARGTGPSVLLAPGGGHEPTRLCSPKQSPPRGVFPGFFLFFHSVHLRQRLGTRSVPQGQPPRAWSSREHPQKHERRFPALLSPCAAALAPPAPVPAAFSQVPRTSTSPAERASTAPTPSNRVSVTSFTPPIRPPRNQRLQLAPATSPNVERWAGCRSAPPAPGGHICSSPCSLRAGSPWSTEHGERRAHTLTPRTPVHALQAR